MGRDSEERGVTKLAPLQSLCSSAFEVMDVFIEVFQPARQNHALGEGICPRMGSGPF